MGGAAAATLINTAQGVINGAIPSGSAPITDNLTLNNDGTYQVAVSTGNWVTPATTVIAAYYQVKVDVTSGSFTSGDVTGSFLDSSVTRQWLKGAVGTVVCTITFREKASGIVRSVQTGVTIITT